MILRCNFRCMSATYYVCLLFSDAAYIRLLHQSLSFEALITSDWTNAQCCFTTFCPIRNLTLNAMLLEPEIEMCMSELINMPAVFYWRVSQRSDTETSACVFYIDTIRYERYYNLEMESDVHIILETRAVLSPGNRAKPCKCRYVKSVRNFMWKLCYRKDRAMRPIRGCPEKFRGSLTTPTATIPKNFYGLLFRSTIWMILQNYLKSV